MVLDRVVVARSGSDADLPQGDTLETVPSVKRFGCFYQPVSNGCIGSGLWGVWHLLGRMFDGCGVGLPFSRGLVKKPLGVRLRGGRQGPVKRPPPLGPAPSLQSSSPP